MFRVSEGHEFFVTDSNMMGFCTNRAIPTDEIFVIIGCDMPVVLRPVRSNGTFMLVGLCYVHGIMYREWVHDMARKAREKRAEEYPEDPNVIDHDQFWNWWKQPSQAEQWIEEVVLA